MLKFKINAAKTQFFDRPVVNAVDRATVRALSRFGAYVRTAARGLIRSGKKPSRPGKPPRNQTGTLKKFLFFVFDKSRRSVVIGPAKTNQVGTAPESLESGGPVTILESLNPYSGKWRRKDMRFRRTDNGGQATWETRKRTVQIEARPFMGPAYAKEKPKLMGLWRDAVK